MEALKRDNNISRGTGEETLPSFPVGRKGSEMGMKWRGGKGEEMRSSGGGAENEANKLEQITGMIEERDMGVE